MVDIPGNASTTTTVTVGSSTFNVLESVGDHDWFKINLTSGQEITVALDALGTNPDLDTYLIIRDNNGVILYDRGGALVIRRSALASADLTVSRR